MIPFLQESLMSRSLDRYRFITTWIEGFELRHYVWQCLILKREELDIWCTYFERYWAILYWKSKECPYEIGMSQLEIL